MGPAVPGEAGRLVNVFGTGRSGTTVLDLMLGNAPDAFSVGEAYSWFRPNHQRHLELECCCDQRPCPVWAELSRLPARHFHRDALAATGTTTIVDSSKQLSWLLDANRWAAKDGLAVANVAIWKDPVDLAYSFWKRDRHPDWFRRTFIDHYGRFFAMGLPNVAVRHQELMDEPAGLMERLCGHLGMDWEPGRDAFWEKDHHIIGGSHWGRAQVQEGRKLHAPPAKRPEAFEAALPDIRRRIRDDPKMGRLIARLEAADLHAQEEEFPYTPRPAPRWTPWWHWYNRLERPWRRRRLGDARPEGERALLEKEMDRGGPPKS
ncbi:MAG: hypothetical protein ACPGQL_00470 [Thermoplasmatota archaeon]